MITYFNGQRLLVCNGLLRTTQETNMLLNRQKNNLIVLSLFFVIFPFTLIEGKNQHKKSESTTKDVYKIAVCDWMILKRQKIGEFELASQLGSDGIELDMGSLGNRDSFDNKLRKPEFQTLFKQKASEFNMGISSIAMSGFYAQSFAKRTDYKALVEDCLNTMDVMNVKTAYLPLGVNCDLKKNPEIRPMVIERLRTVGNMAAQKGCVIAIETSLSAQEEVELLSEINSKGIMISFNFQNPLTNNRDVCKELLTLGSKRIRQIHGTDTDGVLLQNNKRLNMTEVKKTLDKMKWKGWIIVERSRDTTDVHNIKLNYGSNIKYLKSVFQP